MDDPGVPRLLEHLAAMTGESVYLWHTPSRTPAITWHVWSGAPAGTGGGQWGTGLSPWDALNDAFTRVTRAIFEGRITGSEGAR